MQLQGIRAYMAISYYLIEVNDLAIMGNVAVRLRIESGRYRRKENEK